MSKKVVIAPLNWGLGHATRCIPIINYCLQQEYQVIVATDGIAMRMLKKEYANTVAYLDLPSYGITYSDNMRFHLEKSLYKVFSAIYQEYKVLRKYCKENDVDYLISDNRLGCYVKGVKSAYITHQLTLPVEKILFLADVFHHYFIKKHHQLWVPDVEGSVLSGELSKTKKALQPKFLGIISRMKKQEVSAKDIDILIVLSGIEFQRNQLEQLVLEEFKNYDGKVVLVRGAYAGQEKIQQSSIEVLENANSEVLSKLVARAKLVFSRSGYTTILDLAKVGAKAFFIPTPGQKEQEYLATYLTSKNIANSSVQKEFSVEQMEENDGYKGFLNVDTDTMSFDRVMKSFFV